MSISLRINQSLSQRKGSGPGSIRDLYPKSLGVEWDSAKDVMSTSLCLPTAYQSTKRGVLSDVARTFDVLGWLAPTIIVMKMLYQRLWDLKIAWDDPLPSHLVEQHVQWRSQLPLLASRS